MQFTILVDMGRPVRQCNPGVLYIYAKGLSLLILFARADGHKMIKNAVSVLPLFKDESFPCQ